MKINAAFQGKQLSMEEEPCEVRKVISLPDKEYAFFKKHLMYEYDFLRKNVEQMGFRNGTRQCVLVMGESSEDGVLVDSSGYGYARYTAPFLGARSYMTLQEQNLQANGELKTLTADDLAILHAKHTLWVYGAGGEQADFSHCRIAGLSLGDMQFNGACFRDAVLEDVDFGNAGVCGADFSGARFVHCRMDGIAAEECDFRDAVFENCTLAQAHLAHSNLTGATMKDCVLCGADLRNCCMENLSMEDADLEDAYTQGVMRKEQDWEQNSSPCMTMG